ncbi:hypothetical protein [Streptomyces sp. NPDC016675]|uniref:hypothetical protein n=1 Tax=Streptomyces sp. NPDC016675 TaxID=3364970 RepID=UPI0036FABD12
MNTYVIGRGHTSHYKQPGSHLTYCGRTTGTPGVGTRMCAPCVKAEARERAEAETVANDHREGAAEQSLAQSLTPKMRKVLPAVVAAGDFRDAGLANLPKGVTDPSLQGLIRRGLAERYDSGETFVGFSGRAYKVMRYRATDLGRAVADALAAEQTDAECDQFATTARAVDAVTHAENTGAAVATIEDAEALYAAAVVTEAEATEGTWRGEWIGETDTAGALFSLTPNREQGALFT